MYTNLDQNQKTLSGNGLVEHIHSNMDVGFDERNKAISEVFSRLKIKFKAFWGIFDNRGVSTN